MPIFKPLKFKKRTKKDVFKTLALILSVILPVMVLIVTIFIFSTPKDFWYGKKITTERGTEIKTSSLLKPSEILSQKAAYRGQKVALIGKVNLAPIVCETKDCPEEDPCCGCDLNRDLAVYDTGVSFTQPTGEILKIKPSSDGFYCQRIQGTCDYECPDWALGGVYEALGTLVYKPIRGVAWKISEELFFIVSEKELKGEEKTSEKFFSVFEGLKDFYEKYIKAPSHYLPD